MKQRLQDLNLDVLLADMRHIFFHNNVGKPVTIELAMLQDNELTWSETLYIPVGDVGHLPFFQAGVLQICVNETCCYHDITKTGDYFVKIEADDSLSVTMKQRVPTKSLQK